MRPATRWLAALGSSAILAGGALLAQPPVATPTPTPAASAVTTPAPSAAAAVTSPEEKEMQGLLEKLTALSDKLAKSKEGPEQWKLHVEQGDVVLLIANRSRGEELDRWLRMAVDCYYGAALQAPAKEPAAGERLNELCKQIARVHPASPVRTYSLYQQLQARYHKALEKAGDNPAKVQAEHRDALVAFTHQHTRSAEMPVAILEAGALSEALNKKADAKACYRYVAENCKGTPSARKARAALSRMGLNDEVMVFKLPHLYTDSEGVEPLTVTMDQLRGRVVVVYFWSSQSAASTEQDFQALRGLSDRYGASGLTVLYVSMDEAPQKAREFLKGKLTGGTHLYLQGGLSSAMAEQYNLTTLPQAFVVSGDGTVVKHQVAASTVESEVSKLLGPVRATTGTARRR